LQRLITIVDFCLFPFSFLVAFFLLGDATFSLFRKEVLSCHHLDVFLTRQLLRRERSVLLLLLGSLLGVDLLALNILLFELRQESFPILIGHIGILLQLTLNHEFFNTVDGVSILHAVDYNSLHCLQIFKFTHHRNSVTLHKDVALIKQLQGFEGHAVGANETLSTLDEFLAIPDDSTDLDHFAKHLLIGQDLNGLLVRDRTSQEFDKVATADDHVGVPSLPRRFD